MQGGICRVGRGDMSWSLKRRIPHWNSVLCPRVGWLKSPSLVLVNFPANDLLLSMYGAVATVSCVWKIQKIRQICRLWGDVRKLEAFQLQGAKPPWTLTRGSAPGLHWGLRPHIPVIGSRSARSPCNPPFTNPETLFPRRSWPSPLNPTGDFRCPDSPELISPSLVCITNTTLVAHELDGSHYWCIVACVMLQVAHLSLVGGLTTEECTRKILERLPGQRSHSGSLYLGRSKRKKAGISAADPQNCGCR